MRDESVRRIACLRSLQIDARNLVIALHQLLAAERLEQAALPDGAVVVSPGGDLRVWMSLRTGTDVAENERRDLSRRVVEALAKVNLHLTATMAADEGDIAERLLRSESMFVD